jgi:hypothetical protein
MTMNMLYWKEEEPGLWSGSDHQRVIVEAWRSPKTGKWSILRDGHRVVGPCRTRAEAIRDYEEWAVLPEGSKR